MELVGKTFRAVTNTASGTINTETTMTFTSEAGALLGVYAGGMVSQGSVIARRTGEATIEMVYHCLTTAGELKAGRASGKFGIGADGQLRMYLDWQWLTGDQATGHSEWLAES
jgi:hypothetical protein